MIFMQYLAFEGPTLDLDITMIIQVCLFVLVMLFLNKYVLKPYLKAYEAREALTTGTTDEAKTLKEKAEAAQNEYVSKRQVVFAEVEANRKQEIASAQNAQAEALAAKRSEVQASINEKQAEFDRSMSEARCAADAQINAISSEITAKLLA